MVRRAQEAARKYVESRFGGKVEMATPIRRPRTSNLANLPNGPLVSGGLRREESNPRKRSLSAVLDAVEPC